MSTQQQEQQQQQQQPPSVVDMIRLYERNVQRARDLHLPADFVERWARAAADAREQQKIQ